MRNGNNKPLLVLNLRILPQLEVETIEPRRNNNTATSVKRSQTLILAEDGDDGSLVQITLTVVAKESLGNGHKGVKQP